MQNKSKHINVIPSTAVAAAGSVTSQPQFSTWGRGIRFFIASSAPVAGGGTDSVFLCAIPPRGGPPVPITGFSGANLISVAGTHIADFYPGAWLPVGTLPAGGALIGALGIELSMEWAVEITFGAGNSGTVVVDAEMMP